MKTNTFTDPKNSFTTNQEVASYAVEIGDPALILSYMRKESYKYHLRTSIQEYLSNALDAHRESKQTQKRVLVKAPTIQDPTLSIKDFGTGMSPERIEKVWTKVGVSSKRSNNQQKGGFGAGSKTLFAYTDMFLITTVVDGLKYEYEATVARKAGGEIILKKHPYETSEPNGTEIKSQIHPNDIWKAQEAIKRFCFFCEKHEMPEVLGVEKFKTIHDLKKDLIGIPNDEMDSAFILKNDDVPHSTLGTRSDKIMFVLDGIPYVVEDEYRNLFHKSTSKIKGQLVVKFKTGVIKPQLSREAIMVCDENTKIIEAVSALVNKKLNQEIDYMLKDSTNIKDFMSNFFKVLEKYTLTEAKFKDYNFYSNYQVTSENFSDFIFDYRYKRHTGTIKKEEDYSKIHLDSKHASSNYWGDLSIESEAKMGRRINEVMLNNDKILVIKKPAGVDDKLFQEIISLFQLKSIHDVEPREIERELREKKVKAAESYNLHTMHSHYYSGVRKDINNYKADQLSGKKIVYIPLDDYAKERSNEQLKYTVEFFRRDYLFAFIGKEELSRLKKLDTVKLFSFPEFCKSLKTNNEDLMKVIGSKVKNTEICGAILNSFKMSPKDFKNKTVRSVLETYKNNDNFSNKIKEVPNFVSKLYESSKELENFLTLDKDFAILFKERLPLITKNNDWKEMKLDETGKEDLLNYINLKTK